MNISRHSLIFGLSYALDIAGKNNLSHSKSTAYLSVMIGREIGLSEDKILNLYYTALLHDIALSATYEMVPHCLDGKRIVQNLPLAEEIADAICYHHEFYDGSGIFKLSGDNIPKIAAIVCFASAFDDEFGRKNFILDNSLYATIIKWLDKKKALFSKDILNAFGDLVKREYFLLDYFNHETKYKLSNRIIIGDNVCYDYEDVEKYALCFADIIDCRSPFTYTHSYGLAKTARKFTAALGYNGETQNKMYIAGLLHDLGKLYISADILHKPDKLTADERFEMNKHTYYTRKILEQIDGFEDIVNYASNHHEKLDGTGYPYHLSENQLGELDRVMAICDVYQALTEERPYRENLSAEKVWGIIDNMVKNHHLDEVLVDKLKTIF